MSRPRRPWMSNTERENFEKVNKRDVSPTKFLDKGTLETLGLDVCMLRCLKAAGLGRFMTVSAPSYETLSKEFIATFKVSLDGDTLEAISFKYKGNAYTVSAEEARAAIGITRAPFGDWNKGAEESELFDFWVGATGQAFNVGSEYSNKITHPCLRLLHKLIMGTLLGHPESNKVPLKDLHWLYCALPQADYKPDWLRLILGGLRRIRAGERRDIVQGGLITLIAETVLQVEEDEEPVISHVFDLARLRQINMLKTERRNHFWCTYTDRSHVMALPREIPYSHTYQGWYLHPDPITTHLGTGPSDFVDEEPGTRARRVRRREVGSSSQAPTADADEEMRAAGQDPPPMDPWQEMMYQQLQAMSLQNQTWQQGMDTRVDGLQSQFGEFRTQIGELGERVQHLGEQQYHYFGQHPWPPPGPSQ